MYAAAIGATAALAPRYFFDDFPLHARWIAALPPYNEHLVRDVGDLYLGLAVLLTIAAVRLGPDLVRAALLTALVTAVPHLIFHAGHRGAALPIAAAAQTAVLGAAVVLPAGLLLVTQRVWSAPGHGLSRHPVR